MRLRITLSGVGCSLCILALLAHGQEKSSRLTFDVAAIRHGNNIRIGALRAPIRWLFPVPCIRDDGVIFLWRTNPAVLTFDLRAM